MASVLEKFTLRGRRTLAKRENERINLDIEILEFRNRKFVTGLHWEPLNSALKYKKEAKEIAARFGWDVVAYRRTRGGIQAGFVSTSDGAVKRMYSVAATLAGEFSRKYGDRWLGIFEVSKDAFLFLGVWDGMIIPSTDIILNREQAPGAFSEVLNRYVGDKGSFEERYLFAPRELELAAQEVQLKDVLEVDKLRSEYQLRALKFALTPEEVRTAIAVAVIAFFAWKGIDILHQRQLAAIKAKVDAEAARKAAALEAANANARKKLAETALAHPWAVLPSARDFVDACENATDPFPPSIAGWPFSDATCSGSTLTVVYKKKVGTTEGTFGETVAQGLLALAHALGRPVLLFSNTGSVATITLQLKVPVAGDDSLVPDYAGTSAFLGTLEPANSDDMTVIDNLKLQEQAPKAPAAAPVDGASAVPPQPLPWRQYAFSLDSKIQPQAIMQSMKISNGLRITKIVTTLNADSSADSSADSASLVWTISGDLYVKK